MGSEWFSVIEMILSGGMELKNFKNKEEIEDIFLWYYT